MAQSVFALFYYVKCKTCWVTWDYSLKTCWAAWIFYYCKI